MSKTEPTSTKHNLHGTITLWSLPQSTCGLETEVAELAPLGVAAPCASFGVADPGAAAPLFSSEGVLTSEPGSEAAAPVSTSDGDLSCQFEFRLT